MKLNPKEIMESTTEEIRTLINEILKIEKKYEYKQNISPGSTLESDITEEIIRVINKEIQS